MALFQGFVPLPTAYLSKTDAMKSGEFGVPDRYGRRPTFNQNAPRQSWNEIAPAKAKDGDLLKNPVEWFASRGANVTALQLQREQELVMDKLSDKDFERTALTRRRFHPRY